MIVGLFEEQVPNEHDNKTSPSCPTQVILSKQNQDCMNGGSFKWLDNGLLL